LRILSKEARNCGKVLKNLVYGKIGEIDYSGISRVIWAFAKINHNDVELWKLFSSFALKNIQNFSDNELIKVIWSFAYIKKGEDQFWSALEEMVSKENFGKTLNGYEFYSLLWSFTEVKKHSNGFWFKMTDKLVKYGEKFNEKEKKEIMQLLKNNNIYLEQLDKVLGA